MMQIQSWFLLLFTFITMGWTNMHADEPELLTFTPPSGWHVAESDKLSPHVKVLVIGPTETAFPPSINLCVEAFSGDPSEYLDIVKSINSKQGSEWKNLGTLKTQSGEGNLSQVDLNTQWGTVRMMHVILCQKEQVYILTAAALKEEFPKFYKTFFTALRSLKAS